MGGSEVATLPYVLFSSKDVIDHKGPPSDPPLLGGLPSQKIWGGRDSRPVSSSQVDEQKVLGTRMMDDQEQEANLESGGREGRRKRPCKWQKQRRGWTRLLHGWLAEKESGQPGRWEWMYGVYVYIQIYMLVLYSGNKSGSAKLELRYDLYFALFLLFSTSQGRLYKPPIILCSLFQSKSAEKRPYMTSCHSTRESTEMLKSDFVHGIDGTTAIPGTPSVFCFV